MLSLAGPGRTPSPRALLQAAQVSQDSLDKLFADFNLDGHDTYDAFLGIDDAILDRLGICVPSDRSGIKRAIEILTEGVQLRQGRV
jgi:hypothetical protein